MTRLHAGELACEIEPRLDDLPVPRSTPAAPLTSSRQPAAGFGWQWYFVKRAGRRAPVEDSERTP
jgi:hypothetical protein